LALVASRLTLPTTLGRSPRLGQNYLLYVASKAGSDSIWKVADGAATEVWSGSHSRVIGAPAMAPDGRRIAFSVEEQGNATLYVMNDNGTGVRPLSGSLDVRGTMAWAPDGRSLIATANHAGVPRLFKVSADGQSTMSMTAEYSTDPAWSPDGRFLVYSGADVGTTLPVRAVTPDGRPHPTPNLILSRGARRVCFLPGRRALVILRGDLEHKNVWLVDLDTAVETQLTDFGRDFVVRDFDVSPDGREMVLERIQENADVVLVDLPSR
jgi:Tol biopolymer transport system component